MPNNPQDQSLNDWLFFGTQPAPDNNRKQKPERNPRRGKADQYDPFAALFEPVQSPVEPAQDPFFIPAPTPVAPTPAPAPIPAAPIAPAPVAAPAPAPVNAPAPVMEAGGTVKLYDAAQSVQAPPAEEPSAEPEAPAEPEKAVEPEVPAPVMYADGTVKLYAERSVNVSAIPGLQIDPAASMRAAGALKPVQLPDELRHFSPGEVEQNVSSLSILCGGQTFTFDKPLEISIGRRPGNTLVVPDLHVSSDHVVLNCTYSGVTARNVSQVRNGKQNPVYINDVELRQPTPLNNGDILKLNCVPLTVTWVTETVTRAAPAAVLPEPFTPAEPPVVMELPVAPVAEPVVEPEPIVEPEPVVEPEPNQSAWTTVVPVQQLPDASATLQSLYLTVRWTLPGQALCEQIVALNGLRPLVIGRSEKDDVFIDDPRRSVSRNHLTLTMEGSLVTVHNSSTDPRGNPGYNPVLVAGKKLESPLPLDDCLGKEIRLGLALLTIHLAE